MKIAYLDGSRLRRALIAASDYAQHWRAALNRINVFPVPDGDTGTNLTLTVRGIAERLRASRDRTLAGVARQAAEAGILGARGNCGMILSHFLVGFSDAVEDRTHLSVSDFAAVLRSASDHLYGSLEKPVEGTILTVIRETAEAAESATSRDFADLVGRLLSRARLALARTQEMLPALRSAGVVDAGGKGFVHLLEGIEALVQGQPITSAAPADACEAAPAAGVIAFASPPDQYRFCTEALVRGRSLPSESEVRAALREMGDSLIAVRGAGTLKVHIHTDEPGAVLDHLRALGELVTHKAEDMRAQHAVAKRAAAHRADPASTDPASTAGPARTGAGHSVLARRPYAIVTDSVCDLPEEVVHAHGIHVVPVSLVYGDEVLRDRVDIDEATYVERLRRGERPTTSQPPPAAFFDAYERAAEDGEQILAVLLASSLSGTYSSGEAAARRFSRAPVHVIDTRGASLTEGLLVLRAAELAERAVPPQEIAAELDRIRDRSGIFFTVDTLEYVLASGRVSRGQAWIANLLGIKPILWLNPAAQIVAAKKVRGRGNVLSRMLGLIEERVPPGSATARFGIIHVGCPEVVDPIRRAIRSRYGRVDILVSQAAPALATHLGPGAWGIAYQDES